MKGTITVTRGDEVAIHTYTSPPNSWLVNTQILEGPVELVIFDGQLLNAYAEEAADYASNLDKPVDRIIVSHGHPITGWASRC
jgi:hypothetical protein